MCMGTQVKLKTATCASTSKSSSKSSSVAPLTHMFHFVFVRTHGFGSLYDVGAIGWQDRDEDLDGWAWCSWDNDESVG